MGKAHADALVAFTEELEEFTGRVFLVEAPHGTVPPYVVWHPAKGVPSQVGVTGPYAARNPRFTGHVVAKTAGHALVLMDALEDHLFPGGRGVTIAVEGERSHPLWFTSPVPVQKQSDPQPTIFYGVVECGWRTQPDVTDSI